MELVSLTDRIIDCLDSEISKKDIHYLVWLGTSPGIPIVHKLLRNDSISQVMVADNDINKQGWSINVDGCLTEQKEIKVSSFEALSDNPNTLYICANTHYRDFVVQLSKYDIPKERIIDLNGIQIEWMNSDRNNEVQKYHRILGRELQLEELKILKWFRDFCGDNNLRWYLGEGSLLGAVRHGGFIPWDDDIDTFMPYEDYLQLIELMPDTDGYRLIDWRKDDRYPFQFAKIIEDNTFQLHPTPFGYVTLGCYIDIFPIAGYPIEEGDIKLKYQRNKELDFEWDKSIIEYPYSGKSLLDIRTKITQKKYNIGFKESKKVGTMQQIAGNAWAIDKEFFGKSNLIKFEDDMFPAPNGYHEFLTARYDKYMELPPEEKRRVHSFPTYLI